MKTVILSIIILATSGIAHAQTVSPVIQELRQKTAVQGSFTLTNQQTYPMAAIIEVKSFTVQPDGSMTTRNLDSNIHVKLSETSMRIPAQQDRAISFEASCEKAPCWFIIFSAFQLAKNAQGVIFRISLPEVVYVTDRDIDKSAITVHATDNGFDVVNDSDQYVRAQKANATVNGKKVSSGGFPCFPHSHHLVTLDGKPERVEVIFPKFKATV